MSITLPPVDALIDQLAAQMRPHMTPDTVLVGIHTGGVWIAERLQGLLGLTRPPASIDVSFHRDDHHLGNGLKAGGKVSHLPDHTEGAHLVVVDDVLNTGRTIRAALNEIFDYGRPASVLLAALVDIPRRELPIQPDISGIRMALQPGQRVKLAGPAPLSLTLSQ